MKSPLRTVASLLAIVLLSAAGCANNEEDQQNAHAMVEDPCASLHAQRAELLRYLQGLTSGDEIARTKANLQKVEQEIRDCESRSRTQAGVN